MSGADYHFGSPEQRRSTVYLEHVAGFEVPDTSGNTTFVTVEDLECDADAHPITLRGILRGEQGEVAALSGEFLLRNLVIPNLPVGFYGDKEEAPAILSVGVEIKEADHDADRLEYAKARGNTASIKIVPSLGRLSSVSCIREPELGGYGIDWFAADRACVEVSLFGGLMVAEIKFDQPLPDVVNPDDLAV